MAKDIQRYIWTADGMEPHWNGGHVSIDDAREYCDKLIAERDEAWRELAKATELLRDLATYGSDGHLEDSAAEFIARHEKKRVEG